jgi:hypothetical protein
MPKNYGAGIVFGNGRLGAVRALVRLGRRELWLRLDRNMIVNRQGEPLGQSSNHRDPGTRGA